MSARVVRLASAPSLEGLSEPWCVCKTRFYEFFSSGLIPTAAPRHLRVFMLQSCSDTRHLIFTVEFWAVTLREGLEPIPRCGFRIHAFPSTKACCPLMPLRCPQILAAPPRNTSVMDARVCVPEGRHGGEQARAVLESLAARLCCGRLAFAEVLSRPRAEASPAKYVWWHGGTRRPGVRCRALTLELVEAPASCHLSGGPASLICSVFGGSIG